MDEETKIDEKSEEEKKETKPEGAEKNSGEGNKPTTTPLIDIANAAAERMEKANKETARLQEAQSERDQRIALGGRSDAGQPAEKPKEIDSKEYAEKVLSGKLDDKE